MEELLLKKYIFETFQIQMMTMNESETSVQREKLKALVHKEYLGKSFAVTEFNKWIERYLLCAANISDCSYYRIRELAKIRQEGYPISIFINSGLLPVETVRPKLEMHARGDAMLVLSDGTTVDIEVTCVKDGEFDLEQAKHVDKFGYASILGVDTGKLLKAVIDGVPCSGEAVSASDRITKRISDVNRRIAEKVEKSYQVGTILLVAIEDDFQECIGRAIQEGVGKPLQSSFSKIFIVSVTTKRCWQIY